ncbi:two-component system, OmpR family, sensor histidine kinase MtrB [Sinosporangium album]|uniref:histidine kinase n=1 Tax=Sinosporangium album TaxID=504805 RepID=A0A1G7XXR8_9ACTN|nr:sensor histidine kinase [Sinosporangium album]SDG89012.1 two-component system, OmpR family, sensor histidine kinase MtrB [Sinosporangium album]
MKAAHRLLPTGLRGRLVITFTLVAIAASALVAGMGYGLAKNALTTRTEDVAVTSVSTALERITLPLGSLWPGEPAPTAQDLEELRSSLGGSGRQVVMEYQDNVYAGSMLTIADVPNELRARAAWRLVTQRVRVADRLWLLLGTQVQRTTRGGQVQPTGLKVFVFVSLDEEERLLNELRSSLATAGGITLLIALTGALFSARRVLLPVRRLRDAARALGAGHLNTRLPVRGRDELAELTATFNETAAALEKSVAELRNLEAMSRRFVADVSHELRTPLTAMTAVTELLLEEAERLPKAPAEAVRLVLHEVERLRVLVEQLIETSKFDSGAATLSLETVNVNDVICDSLEIRGWTGAVRVEASEWLTFHLDPRRFDVIVANLVGNAQKHGAPPVELTVRDTPHGLEVKVRDHGKGIPPEAIGRVFDRFYKSSSSGSGLGLPIARSNAQLHGGTISVRPQDPGVLFTVWLPRR